MHLRETWRRDRANIMRGAVLWLIGILLLIIVLLYLFNVI